MLYCDLCNYYKSVHAKNQNIDKCMCELTGFVFHIKPEEYNLDKYPCFDYELKTRTIATEELRENLMANFKKRKPA